MRRREGSEVLTCARLEVVVLARSLTPQSEAWERNLCFACSRCFVLASAWRRDEGGREGGSGRQTARGQRGEGEGRRSEPAGRSRAHPPLERSASSLLGVCLPVPDNEKGGSRKGELTVDRLTTCGRTDGRRSERELATLTVGWDGRGRPTGSCFRGRHRHEYFCLFFPFARRREEGRKGPLTLSRLFARSLEQRVRTWSGIFVAEEPESVVVRLSLFFRPASEMDITLLLMTLAAEQCG